MSTTQERFAEFAQRGQNEFADAVQASFELGESLLASQRRFATSVFTAGLELAESARKAAEVATEATVAAVRKAAEEQEVAVRTAAERATRTTA